MARPSDTDRINDGTFFVGDKPCRYSHAPVFRRSTGICIQCERDRSKEYQSRKRAEKDPEVAAKKAAYMAKYSKEYNAKPEVMERRRAVDRAAYRRKVEHFSKKNRAYRTANPDKVAFHASKSRRGKKHATPDWLTDAQRDKMMQFYIHARDCFVTSGQRYDVDHIVPLNGKTVCGLHVPWNLQVLPRDINTSKKNKFNQGE